MYYECMPSARSFLAVPALLLAGCRQPHDVPLLTAAQAGDWARVESLLGHGGDANRRNDSGITPLILAARTGQIGGIRMLLRHGADPNLPGGLNEWTPLMHATHKNQLGAVQALLESGAEVNSRGRSGETALMMAAGYGFTPIVEMLLDRGADPWAKTPDGDTVFAVALTGVPDPDRFTLGSCHIATVEALKRKVPTLHLPDNLWGRFALLAAGAAKLRGCPY
jgi:hypothetical protein